MIKRGARRINFDPRVDIPPLKDKVILITGGTDGLGKESIRQLSLHRPAQIYFTARSRSKGEGVLTELKQQDPDHGLIKILDMNLDSLASVNQAARKFTSDNDRLDIVICNAGQLSASGTTQDGYERSFGVNHLGHALLVKLLMPTLLRTAEGPGRDVRVVFVSSKGESWAPKDYTFDRMKSELSDLNVMAKYAQSKLANIHYAAQLAREHPGILSLSVHPGHVSTNFTTDYFRGRPILGSIYKWAEPRFTGVVDVLEGVKGQLWAATAQKEDLTNGEYYWPVGVTGKGSIKTRDEQMAKALWTWTEEQLQPYLEGTATSSSPNEGSRG